MERFRYAAALVLLVSMPGGLLYWFSIHPFIAFWRRRGLALTLSLHLVAAVGLGVALYRWKEPLLAREFGTHGLLVVVALLVLALAARLGWAVTRQLKLRTMVGLPELDPAHYPQPLLTQGVYAWIRHPRYVQMSLGLLGWALLTNYLAGYAVWLLGCVALAGVARLEERELRVRFGAAYDDYARRVPRFLPRWWLIRREPWPTKNLPA